MELFAAIDLRAGRCVRLIEGDFARETVYDRDPLAVAESFVAGGAPWIHVVDLDAARTGEAANRPIVIALAKALRVRVQAGGGVRNLADAEALLSSGVSRVVVGTAAVERPELVAEIAQRWPGGVAVGLDHRGGVVRLKGWTESGGRRVDEMVPEAVAAGAAAVIVTDISRDGRMSGPDLAGLAELAEATDAELIASGGVGSLDDLRSLAALGAGRRGLAGVVVGKALHDSSFTVAEAVAACGGGDGGPGDGVEP